jgi:hypothetical protein
MFDLDIRTRVAEERHRELLRQAEEERQAKIGRNGDARRRLRPLPSPGLMRPHLRAERQGRHLGQMIYNCYIELLERGLSRHEALELTKSLTSHLDRCSPGGPRRALG